MALPQQTTIYRDGDYEWNATVTVLDHLDERGACGFTPGELRALIEPERRRIDWEPLLGHRYAIASTGEKALLDIALSFWTGRREVASLADLQRLDDEAFDMALDAARVRRGRY